MYKNNQLGDDHKEFPFDDIATDDAVDTSGPNMMSINRELEEMAQVYNEKGELRPQSQRDLRALAFSFIYAVDRHEYTMDLDAVVASYKDKFELVLDEDSYAITLARGIIDHRDELDEVIKPLLKNWKFERLGCCTRLILRLALWELMQDQASASVIINEAIELSKAFAEKDAYKFINGILDEFSKAKQLKK
jgi:N utilization substance protein B